MKEEKKEHVNLTLNKDIMNKLRRRGYNISQLVRNFLKKKLENEKSKD